jgi:hypothetical protein
MIERRSWLIAAVIAALSNAAAADGVFTLDFAGPQRLEGTAGGVVRGSYDCTLFYPGPDGGAQGWSIGMTAEPGPPDGAAIVSIRVDGTVVEHFFAGGFNKTELVDPDRNGGKRGAVSALVFTFDNRFLPAGRAHDIARIEVEAAAGEEEGAFDLLYVDGLRGSGQPVSNVITQNGATAIPETRRRAVAIGAPIDCCAAGVNVGFALPGTLGREPFEGVLGAGARCGAGDGALAVPVPAGERSRADLNAAIISQLEGPGVASWSLAVSLSGAGEIVAASSSLGGPGLSDFERTQVIDPSANGGRQGAVSEVVISETGASTLPPVGNLAAMRLTVESPDLGDRLGGEDLRIGTLAFEDGLAGLEGPVRNRMAVGDLSLEPCNRLLARVSLRFERAEGFRRGDANADARVDVADASYALNFLFLGGPAPSCENAADVNDDARVDISDPSFLLNFLFLGGRTVPAPFPGCGVDPSPEGFGCLEGCR